jgi:uncharacterized protein YndB with AHSA1/START domain
MTDAVTEITVPPGEPIIRLRRFFKAPPDLVYRVITEPEYIRRWFGPRRLEITLCEADLRTGGTWRVVQRATEGTEFVFHGEFLELEPPHKRVGTFVWDGAPDAVATETMVCEAVEGGTMVTTTMEHSSVEARDMHVANGMQEGIIDSHRRMDELLAEEQAS